MGKFLWFVTGLFVGGAMMMIVSQSPDSAKQHLNEWCAYIGRCQ